MPRTYGQLVPSVERRLSAYLSLAEKRGSTEPQAGRPTVTISRRFGCEGYPLAERLKELLDAATGETWNIYDKALLERVSHDEHLSMTLLEGLGGPSRAIDSIGFLFSGHVGQDTVFRRIVKHLVAVAEAGRAIIVGRGGAILTQRCRTATISGSMPTSIPCRLDRPKDGPAAEGRRAPGARERPDAREVHRGLPGCIGVGPRTLRRNLQ